MKILTRIFSSIFVLFLLLTGKAFSQTVYDWTDAANNNNWTTAGNWNINGVKATTYPGQTSNTDQVQFAINDYYTNSQRPDLASADSVSVASVTIGDNTSSNGVQSAIYIRIDGKLNVTGAITQNHSNNVGLVGNGTITYPSGYDYSIQTYMYGSGKVYCQTFQVGDNTTSLVDGVNNITRFSLGNGSVGQGLTTIVSGNLIINSKTKNDASTDAILSVSNANFGIYSGSLTVGGQIRLQNTGDINYSTTQFQPQARFSMQAYNNGSATYLYLKGATALWAQPKDPTYGKYGSNYFDFFLVDRQTMISNGGTSSTQPTLNNVDKTVVVYSGNADQEVFTNSSFPQNSVLDKDGGQYEYLEFSGSGKKTIDATTDQINYPLYISGDLTIDAGSETVDLSTNNPKLVLNNDNNLFTSYGSYNINWTIPTVSQITIGSGATFQNGTVAFTVPGATINNGTFNTSSSNGVIFSGALSNTGTFNQSGSGVVTASSTTANSGTYNQSGSGTLTFTGAFTNSGNFNQSAGTINFNNSYTNTGTFRATGGTENLNQSGTLSLVDNSTAKVGSSITPASGGTTFFNVNALNGGTVSMTGTGQFYVASTGTLNMSNNTALTTGGILTLVSDVNGAATVTAIPSGCTISGNVDVQRYVSANRAYRLVSSPVYTANDGTNNIYSVNYLLTNTYLTGPGNGFDKTGNPTLYLYRENMAPQYSSFLNSNFRGIADISAAPNYSISGDGTYNIPVGNGYLFYFRGSRTQAKLPALTTAGAAATTDTLNAVGVLNQGSITVHDWYTPSSGNLGYTTASNDATIEGMNLVGNPYASSINWDNFSSTNSSAAIYGPNVSKFSYKLIPTGLQGSGNYDVYQAGTGGIGTQGTSNANIIASGEGFFVQAINASASLKFTESAKTSTLVTGGNLYMSTAIARTVPQYLRLQMAMDTVNTDGIIINFDPSTKPAFDPTEDARYKTGTGKVSLSSLSTDNVALAINGLPLSNGLVISLKVGASSGGTYKLNMKSISGIPQVYDVWLKDAVTRDSVNMRTTSSYSFTINTSDTSTFGSRRFTIAIEQNPAMAYKLLSFNASKVDGKPAVQAVWTTQNEQNYTNFTVERSIDNGKTFVVIGSVASSGQGTYSFTDNSPVNGDNQYRLKQEDINNNITYSNTADVVINTATAANMTNLSVYPNPVNTVVNLAITSTKPAEQPIYDIRVVNSAGTIIKQSSASQANWQANVSDLFTGSYIIQVYNSKDKSLVGQTKFVKL
ncbi:MAG TPA: T9SS type A sorting domain-containing protein [Mucilaginibacter sp.]|nr:T9SS type A sorting domain-containing protein [Mucilaginibacter sp.]